MNHYTDHVIKWEKYVTLECDCQFSGALQSPGTCTASQQDRVTREEEEEWGWYVSSSLFITYTVMRQVLSKVTLAAFADNYPNDSPLPKLQGMSVLNPKKLTALWGMGLHLRPSLSRPSDTLRNTPSFTRKLQWYWVCVYCFQIPLDPIKTFILKLLATISPHLIKRRAIKGIKWGGGGTNIHGRK